MATAPNPNGDALTEYFQPTPAATTADLYLNPQIRLLAAPAGTGTPTSLGGSTGPLGQLQNGDWLDVSVSYENGTGASFELQLENLTSATLAMPAIAAPSPVNSSSFIVTWEGACQRSLPVRAGLCSFDRHVSPAVRSFPAISSRISAPSSGP